MSVLSSVRRLFLDHPREIGEGYLQHAGHALTIAGRLVGAGLACLVHALVPGLFVRTASLAVEDVVALMESRKEAASGSASFSSRHHSGDVATGLPATMMENPSN